MSRALRAAVAVGILAAVGAFAHIDPQKARLDAVRADLRRLLRDDPEQLERVLAWAGELPDVAEEAYRRLCMGWVVSECGEWIQPHPAPRLDDREAVASALQGLVADGLARRLGTVGDAVVFELLPSPANGAPDLFTSPEGRWPDDRSSRRHRRDEPTCRTREERRRLRAKRARGGGGR